MMPGERPTPRRYSLGGRDPNAVRCAALRLARQRGWDLGDPHGP
jgi:hypothetical protein